MCDAENAQLIAAAPELLEALKEFKDRCLGEIDVDLIKAIKAIAKAEGR